MPRLDPVAYSLDNTTSIRVAERLGERYEGQTEVMGRTALVCAIGREE